MGNYPMAKAVVTGLNGTVAPYVKSVLESKGFDVVKFDREKVDVNNEGAIVAFLDSVQPSHIFHLATGPGDWHVFLARYAFERQVRFVYTSTELVFSEENNGPYTVDTPADKPYDGFGGDKRETENKITAVNPNAYILRLGWQLGDTFEKNNILAALESTHRQQGRIEASSQWILATAFVKDSAEFIFRIPSEMEPGIYHLNGNPGISFFDLVNLVNKKYQKNWTIVETATPKRDGRLLDPRVKMPMVTEQFPEYVDQQKDAQSGGA